MIPLLTDTHVLHCRRHEIEKVLRLLPPTNTRQSVLFSVRPPASLSVPCCPGQLKPALPNAELLMPFAGHLPQEHQGAGSHRPAPPVRAGGHRRRGGDPRSRDGGRAAGRVLWVEQVPVGVVRVAPHTPSWALQVEQHYAIAPMEAQAALLLAHIRQHCAEDSSYKVRP